MATNLNDQNICKADLTLQPHCESLAIVLSLYLVSLMLKIMPAYVIGITQPSVGTVDPCLSRLIGLCVLR